MNSPGVSTALKAVGWETIGDQGLRLPLWWNEDNRLFQ